MIAVGLFAVLRSILDGDPHRDKRAASRAIDASRQARESIETAASEWAERERRAREETNIAKQILEAKELHGRPR